MTLVDRTGRFVTVDEAFGAMVGIPADAQVGQLGGHRVVAAHREGRPDVAIAMVEDITQRLKDERLSRLVDETLDLERLEAGRVELDARPIDPAELLTTTARVVQPVADEGRGIPADQLEAVFERFRQVEAADHREKGGTGLGLAIARAIVEQHAGRIWAESELGAGATFRFTLPARRAAEALA